MRRNQGVQAAFDLPDQPGSRARRKAASTDQPTMRKKGKHMADTYGNASTPGAGAETVPTENPSSPGTFAATIDPTETTRSGAGTTDTASSTGGHTSEARSRFSAALEEAKAGAAALGAEAKERASSYRDQAKSTGGTWSTDAKGKAGDLAYEGKAKASDALSSLSRLVADNAGTVEEKLGAKYGDYVRTASQSLQDGADKLNQKSIEELGEDARAFVRSSPGAAVGLAALTGFLFARILRK